MKRFDYIIIAGKFEKSGYIFKENITEVYEEIYKFLNDHKAKKIKIEIIEKEEKNGND